SRVAHSIEAAGFRRQRGTTAPVLWSLFCASSPKIGSSGARHRFRGDAMSSLRTQHLLTLQSVLQAAFPAPFWPHNCPSEGVRHKPEGRPMKTTKAMFGALAAAVLMMSTIASADPRVIEITATKDAQF